MNIQSIFFSCVWSLDDNNAGVSCLVVAGVYKMDSQVSTFATKKGLAQMLKGGVIMDVVTPEHAIIAEEADRKSVV